MGIIIIDKLNYTTKTRKNLQKLLLEECEFCVYCYRRDKWEELIRIKLNKRRAA